MKLKKLSELLDTIDRACKQYSIPEPDTILVDSDELDFLTTVAWANQHKIYMDIQLKNISVYSLKSTIEQRDFTDIAQAIKYVVQYV